MLNLSIIQKSVYIVALILFLLNSVTFSQTTAQKIDNLIKQYTDYGEFNGSVLISQNDGVILKKGYGYANFEQSTPNSSHTKFYIGSVTKTFTDMLVLQMVQKGLIKLDGKVSDYLPNYPKPNGNQVTIYNLLTHTSGIPDYDNLPQIDYEKRYRHEEIMAMFDSLSLQFKPGTKFSYTNSGAFIAGIILEKVTGKSYSNLLQENILAPLRMKNTGYNDSNAMLDESATGYNVYGATITVQSYTDMSIPFSAYGMYSTVEDLQKWNEALYEEKLLSKKYMDIYFTPYKDNWACDWMILKNPFHNADDSCLATLRDGSMSRFICFDTRLVNEKSSIILMNNTASTRMEEMVKSITAILHGKPYALPKKSLQKKFIEIIDQKGLADAVTEVVSMASNTSTYYTSAHEFLRVAYTYEYHKKDLKSAIRVFELISKLFPGTYNAYDSDIFADTSNVYRILGEAYVKDGQINKAIECFNKALALNINDMAAAEDLHKLTKK